MNHSGWAQPLGPFIADSTENVGDICLLNRLNMDESSGGLLLTKR
jgi:hypothetical protein